MKLSQLGCDAPVLGRYCAKIKKEFKGADVQERKTDMQLEMLEVYFVREAYPDEKGKQIISDQTQLSVKQVSAWFLQQRKGGDCEKTRS